MKKASTILTVLLFSRLLTAQSDPVATSILDRFSAKALQAPAVTMEFAMDVVDQVNQSGTDSKGKIIICGNKYRLEIPDNIIWFDGENVWTYNPEIEEVTINLPDTSSAFISNPELIFTLYKEGYKQRLLEEKPEGSVIDLYPESISAEFIRIRLLIDKEYNLKEAEYKRKDGYSMFLRVVKYNLKKGYRDSFFRFNSSDYPDAEIIDMR